MFTFNYDCKKSGQVYAYSTDLVFAKPQDEYAWRRGVREYADNYHADHVLTKKDGTRVWTGTDAEYATKAHELCIEAQSRFNAGDVPAERGTVSEATKKLRELAAFLMSNPAALEKAMGLKAAADKKAA